MTLCTRRSDPAAKLATKSAVSSASNAHGDNIPRIAEGARDKSSSRPIGRASSKVRKKTSEVITLTQATDAFAALEHAGHIDLLPNRFMTINLERAGINDPVRVIGHLMKLISDGLRRHGERTTYIWVRETGQIVGDHVHILFYLPLGCEKWFRDRRAGWSKRCGLKRGNGIWRTQIIHGAPRLNDSKLTSAELFAVNLDALIRYVVKHCSEDVQRDLGIISKGPCTVVGKRVSISENLHRKARSRCCQCARAEHNGFACSRATET